MKTIANALLLCGISLFSLYPLRAQTLPIPGQNNGNWIVKEIPPQFKSHMPAKDPAYHADKKSVLKLKAVPIDPRNRQLTGYYDAEAGLRYDFKHGLITDTRTGKVYQFYQKGEKPKALPELPNGSSL